MHGADRHVAAGRFNVSVEHLKGKSGCRDCRASPVQFGLGPNEDTQLMRQEALGEALHEPTCNRILFIIHTVQNANIRSRAIKDRNGSASFLRIAIHVGHFDPEQSVGLRPNLMGCSVINVQRTSSTLNIDSQGLPRKGLLKYPLTQVAGKEETVWPICTKSRKKTQLRYADVLRFIDDHKFIGRVFAVHQLGSQPAKYAGLGHHASFLQLSPNAVEDGPE